LAGPSSLFCENNSRSAHMRATLAAQYRFLPALRHAYETLVQKGTRWVVMVDDDSWVSVPRLLEVLKLFRYDRPIQLGDFMLDNVPNKANHTHWRRPFACGGAGTVLSRAALNRMDWDSCLRSFHGSCQQSDWMIGHCLERAGVMAVTEPGCGTCSCVDLPLGSSKNALFTRVMRGCAFAQVHKSVAEQVSMYARMVGHGSAPLYASYIHATAAILHDPASPFLAKPHCAHSPTERDEVLPATPNLNWPLMVIGAQKAASTSLYARLAQHPQFCLAPAVGEEPLYYTKEKHFFNEPEACARGAIYYASRFPRNSSCSFSVDATPHISGTINIPWAKFRGSAADGHPRKVQHGQISSMVVQALLSAGRVFYTIPRPWLPSIKVVAVLRDPLDRVYSWYKHLVAENVCTSSCEGYTCSVMAHCAPRCAALFDSPPSANYSCFAAKDLNILNNRISYLDWLNLHGSYILPTSVYAPQVWLWRRYFGANLLLLTYEEVLSNTAASLEKVASHAALAPFPRDRLGSLEHKNDKQRVTQRVIGTTTADQDCKLKSRLIRYFEPHYKPLYRLEPTLPQFHTIDHRQASTEDCQMPALPPAALPAASKSQNASILKHASSVLQSMRIALKGGSRPSPSAAKAPASGATKTQQQDLGTG
jgi:hypothetical protein